jgi:hypothetical protein
MSWHNWHSYMDNPPLLKTVVADKEKRHMISANCESLLNSAFSGVDRFVFARDSSRARTNHSQTAY